MAARTWSGRSCRAARRPRAARARRAPRRAGTPRRPPAARGPDATRSSAASKSARRAHRRAVDRQLLPPDAVQVRRRVRPARRAADDDPAAGPRGVRATLPGRLADGLDDDVRAAAGQLLHARGDVPVAWLTVASAPSSRARSSFASDDDVTTTRAPSAFAIASAAVATPPPMPQTSTHSPSLEPRLRDEHPPRGLEDERERRRLLERERVAGSGRRSSPGTAISSACVPSVCSPTTVIRRRRARGPG